VKQYCVSSGILPFGYGYPSDHRAIFIRLDLSKVLSTEVHPSESPAARLLVSATPKEREKFIWELDAHYTSQNLYQCLNDLWETPNNEWSLDHETEFNKCDEQHIAGMLATEKKTCKIKTIAWSPKYSKAVEDRAFLKIALSLRRTHVKPNSTFYQWASARGIDDFSAIDLKTMTKNLRIAQQNLCEIKKQANQLREDHLRELINISQENGDDKQHERRLQILLRVHSRQQSYKRLQNILKPKERSGLSYVLVPENFQPDQYPYDPKDVQKWTMIHEPDSVKIYIMSRNINHFGQAHGSPFTQPPLNSISWAADDKIAETLLQGEIPNDIITDDAYVHDLLRELTKSKHLPEIDTYMSTEDVARGFKRWKESTSTSPSGCHLGLRRLPAIPFNSKELDKTRLAITNRYYQHTIALRFFTKALSNRCKCHAGKSTRNPTSTQTSSNTYN
jgi:hypothetical protein